MIKNISVRSVYNNFFAKYKRKNDFLEAAIRGETRKILVFITQTKSKKSFCKGDYLVRDYRLEVCSLATYELLVSPLC